jgi:poly-gamma-glutamate capsule biosynthesis protein CapA/YwtB (metallophosphatase superfamily)
MKRLFFIFLLLSCGQPSQETIPQRSNTTEATTKSKEVSLWFAGDVHLGASEQNVLTNLREATQEFGCGVINLEGAVSTKASEIINGKPSLFIHPKTLSYLKELGVCLAGIANNHSKDTGEDGPTQTASALREANLTPIGDVAGAALMTMEGMKVAFTAHDLTAGVPASLEEELREAKKSADILISTFHVTGPPSYLPSKELREAVHTAIRAGARLVIAHGSHMIGPVERRGDVIIAWGLGNVAFSCDCTQEEEAILLRVRLTEKSIEAQVVPIFAGLTGKNARLVPAEAQGGIFDLLEAIGSARLSRFAGFASF